MNEIEKLEKTIENLLHIAEQKQRKFFNEEAAQVAEVANAHINYLNYLNKKMKK